jgi:enamine deaminase RidA (YjgF/YER057c/UK114 family)
LALLALACAGALVAWPAKRKKGKDEDKEVNQVLQIPKELPNAVTGDTGHLTFYVTPLTAKGLLTQQVRDALKALDRENGDDTVLQIRAFLAGTGDLRRVRDLISETFTEQHKPLPVVTIVQSGGLPLSNAQVSLEAVAASRKELHPGGLAWISAQAAGPEDPLAPIAPVTERAMASLREEVKAAGSEPSRVLRVTCFLSSLENAAALRAQMTAEYPKSALNLVQTQREPIRAVAGCEAVAAPAAGSGPRLDILNSKGLAQPAQDSQIAIVRSAHTVFTGAQTSFGFEERDARLAFERLQKLLEQTGVSMRDVAFARYYPLSQKIADQVRQVRPSFFDPAHLPAGMLLLFEGLSSQDAGFAVDVVAAKD